MAARSYRFEQTQEVYVFVGDDDVEDQFVPLTSVERIILLKEPGPEHYKIHEEIHREHALLSNRMNWYVTSQAFLVAAFAVGGNSGYMFTWMSRLIPWIGIAITILIAISIGAGLFAMTHFRNLPSYNRNCYGAPPYFHWFGVGAPCAIPFILLVTWPR